MMVRIKNFIRFLIPLILGYSSCLGQVVTNDTLRISLREADSIFLAKNLQLLAQRYNVKATKALIIQARLYPNPNINFEQGAYNPETRKWFEQDFTNGEQAYQISQLIVLSRKIKKQTAIAETNFKLAEDNLFDLLRTLKMALHSSYFNIYYLQQTAKVYDQEISSFTTIVTAYNQVKEKGYVSEADIVLVQSQLYTLKNEYQTLIDNINDLQSQIRLLLQVPSNTYLKPFVDPGINKSDPLSVSLNSLLDSAYVNRTDLKIAKDNLLLSQQNYTLQKALALPDLTAGIGVDRHGSYVTNFNAINLGISIPIFNRNQGNIKNARILVDYNNTQLELTGKILEEQVVRGFQKAMDANKLSKDIDPAFAVNFESLANEMLKNYMKRNVNLLNFLTFYDSFKQNVIQLNSILFNKVNALENLNYLTGTNFFNK